MNIEEAIKKKDLDIILSRKGQIFSLLKSLNKKEREQAWEALRLICDYSKESISNKEKLYLRSLLWHKMRDVRDEAWRNLKIYKSLEIKGVERTLTAKTDKLKFSAWSNVLEMIRLGLTKKEYVILVRHSFWKLLKSRIGTIRKKSWKLFLELVIAQIFQKEDKERFMKYLEYEKIGIRLNAWSLVPKLLDIGFLNQDEVQEKINNIENISKIKTRIGYRAKDIIEKLKFNKGI